MRLRIIDSFLENKKDYDEMAEDYGWYSEYSYIEPLLDSKHFDEETKRLTREKAQEERQKIIQDTENNKKAWEELQPRLKKKELRVLAEIIHTYTYLRSDRMDTYKKAQVKMRSFFDTIAKKLSKLTMSDWTREMVVYCSISEINALLEKAIIPDSNIIKRRMNHEFIYCYENNKEYWITDKQEVKQALKIIDHIEKANQEIKGMIAYKGKARGKVAMVMSKHDLPKVKKGSILVAKTTMPDYTPAMHLAAAFVTEEGGITSHAAVIARELKKPCIVGTGNCTLILKDGDKVEVDADAGIVKKLRGD
jgi:phosphoenolpyruvate synthase/pyruvate phosphate dikinase